MKFVLKDNHIYVVENDNLAYNNIEGMLVTEHLPVKEGLKFLYSINDAPFKDVRDLKISVATSELTQPYFNLKIKVISRDSVDLYVSDKHVITHAVILGQPMENAYPEVIKALLSSVKRIEEKHDSDMRAIKETLLQFVAVIDAIDKKGNLY